MVRRFLPLLVLLALGCAPSRAPGKLEPPPGPTRVLRLATWNLHDLFDEVDDPYSDEVPRPAEVERKLEALARALRSLDADLVAVQEVEKGSLLEALARRAGYREVVLHEGNDTIRGIDVGLMARVPLEGWATHLADDLPALSGVPPGARFSRDCLEVHVAVPGGLVLLVNHLKSQAFGGRRGDLLRQAQAGRVRQIVEGLGSTPAAVLGDLNAAPRSASLAPLLDGTLVDVLAEASFEERVTFPDPQRRSILDYILVNRALAPRVVPGSARVVRGRAFEAASDHLPVVVDLQMPAPEGLQGPEGAPSPAREAPGR